MDWQRLDGEHEAKIIDLRLGKAHMGFTDQMLTLLADAVVELEIAPKYPV